MHNSTVLPPPPNPYLALFNYLSSSSSMASQSTYATSRWCPTPEQLRALEELYRRGIRTPSTFQIQQITAQLRRFGKIEGKNVFYWFQNHKARERQKIRRRLSTASNDHYPNQQRCLRSFQGKTPKGMARRADLHAQQTKISCASALTPLQEAVPTVRADIEKDGWIQHLMMERQAKQRGSQQHQRMCLDLGISPSRHSHLMHSKREDQCLSPVASAKIGSTAEVRPKTLDLFPLGCDDDDTDGDPVRFFEFL